jgi:hypothetical protein
MRITRLQIKNFRRIESLDLETPAAVAVFGMNGAGKSSIRMALHMALYGRCAVTDRRGAGAAELIGDHGNYAHIQVETDNHVIDMTIAKGKTEWTCVERSTGEIIRDRSTFWTSYGIEPEHAMIAGMPEDYLLSKSLGDALASFLGGVVEATELERCIGESFFNQLRAFCDTHSLDWTTVEGLEAVGKKAYELRTNVGRLIKEAEHEKNAIGFQVAPKTVDGRELGVKDEAKVQAQIDALRHRREALISERGAAGNFDPTIDRDAIQAEINTINERVQSLEHQRIKIAEHLGKAAITESLAARNHELAVADGEKTQRALQDAVRVYDAMRKLDTCPTCLQKITASVRSKAVEILEAAVAEARAADEPHSQRALALDDEAQEARRIADGYRKQESEIKARLSDARARQSELSATLRGLPLVAPRAVHVIDADIAQVDYHLKRGLELQEKLKRYCDAEAVASLIDGYNDDHFELSNYVKWFKDGEKIKELVSGGLIDFEHACNAALRAFDRTLSVEVDGKSVEIYLNGIPARQCSRGERAIACYAIAKAFAASGAPILLDDLNDLDAENRRKMLKDIRRDACTWVFSAWQTPGAVTHEVAYALDPCVVVWMEQGKAVPVGMMVS